MAASGFPLLLVAAALAFPALKVRRVQKALRAVMELMAPPAGMESMEPRVPMVNRGAME
jgi:hypothetical protein